MVTFLTPLNVIKRSGEKLNVSTDVPPALFMKSRKNKSENKLYTAGAPPALFIIKSRKNKSENMG